MSVVTGSAAADVASAIIGDAHRVGLRRVSVTTEDGARLTLSLPPTDADAEAVEIWFDDAGTAAVYSAGSGPSCEVCGSRPRELDAVQFTDPDTGDTCVVVACSDCDSALQRRLRAIEDETGEPGGHGYTGGVRLDRSRWTLIQAVWSLYRAG